MQPFIITIARQYGSGGKTIGKMLAERLGIPYYDRDIITMASEDSGVNAVLFSDERLKPDLAHRLRSHFPGGDPVSPEDRKFTRDDNLFRYQEKIIRRLAEQGPCVIIGRCADHILRERKDVVRVFVHAPDDFCLREAMKVDSLPERDVIRKTIEIDDYRAKYYKYYTGQEWKDARNYDLSLNSAVLGFDGTMEAILAYLEVRSRFSE
ncbi:MAG: cytidylate kinase-like family protein [Clostridia bacterium]|nr:cytidylate kinase-like family protein [Clostridia bacterium]